MENNELIEGVVQNGDSILITGKKSKCALSLLATQIACDIATGKKVFGRFQAQLERVLYCDLELKEEEIAKRFQCLLGGGFKDSEKTSNLNFLRLDPSSSFKEKAKAIELAVQESRTSVLFVDPINSMKGEGDSFQKIYSWFHKLSIENGLTVFFVARKDPIEHVEENKDGHGVRSVSMFADVVLKVLSNSNNVVFEIEVKSRRAKSFIVGIDGSLLKIME